MGKIHKEKITLIFPRLHIYRHLPFGMLKSLNAQQICGIGTIHLSNMIDKNWINKAWNPKS